jgi:hypothetical protein
VLIPLAELGGRNPTAEAAGAALMALAADWVTTGWLVFGSSAAAGASGRGAAAWIGRSLGAGLGVGRGAADCTGRGSAGSPLSFSWVPTSTWLGSLMALIATRRLIGTP